RRCRRELLHAMHVAHVDAFPQPPKGDGAIHCARIDISESEPVGQPLGYGTLARARRSVNGYNYALLIRQLSLLPICQSSRITGGGGLFHGAQLAFPRPYVGTACLAERRRWAAKAPRRAHGGYGPCTARTTSRACAER